MNNFNYSKIPTGYYDEILKGRNSVRKFWHYHKFESVLRTLPLSKMGRDKSILDIGCFSGSFLGMIPESNFGFQLGVDILENQIEHAESIYGTDFRKFSFYSPSDGLPVTQKKLFDVITLIEVVEHIPIDQLKGLLEKVEKCLAPDGVLVITTPNYLSAWPVLEMLLNQFSDVSYEEQHITKFNYFNIGPKISSLSSGKFLLLDKTTTHFATPFLAGISYDLALGLSKTVPSSKWHNPFGSIIVSMWRRSNVGADGPCKAEKV